MITVLEQLFCILGAPIIFWFDYAYMEWVVGFLNVVNITYAMINRMYNLYHHITYTTLLCIFMACI